MYEFVLYASIRAKDKPWQCLLHSATVTGLSSDNAYETRGLRGNTRVGRLGFPFRRYNFGLTLFDAHYPHICTLNKTVVPATCGDGNLSVEGSTYAACHVLRIHG